MPYFQEERNTYGLAIYCPQSSGSLYISSLFNVSFSGNGFGNTKDTASSYLKSSALSIDRLEIVSCKLDMFSFAKLVKELNPKQLRVHLIHMYPVSGDDEAGCISVKETYKTLGDIQEVGIEYDSSSGSSISSKWDGLFSPLDNYLNIKGNFFDTVQHILSLPSVLELSLFGLNESHLTSLFTVDMPSVKHLFLAGTDIIVNGTECILSNMPALESLTFNSNYPNQPSINYMVNQSVAAGLSKLKTLSLRGFSGSQLIKMFTTDLPSVRSLHVVGPDITAKTIPCLATRMPFLEAIKVESVMSHLESHVFCEVGSLRNVKNMSIVSDGANLDILYIPVLLMTKFHCLQNH